MSTLPKQLYKGNVNKLLDYIQIRHEDKFLAQYIDYIGWYSTRDASVFWKFDKSLRNSDNWTDTNLWVFNIDKEGNWYFLSVSYMGFVVRVARIYRTKISGNNVAKFDIYWKWVLVLNANNLWSLFVEVFIRMGLIDLTLTRIDYAIDCEKINFRKTNRLNSIVNGWIGKWSSVEYKAFGRRWKSAHFIRYYDKLKELKTHWTLPLYPQYWFLPSVMRYELQVNSEWLDEEQRNIHVSKLPDLANFGYYIDKRSPRYHQWGKTNEDDLEYKQVLKIMNRAYRSGNYWKILTYKDMIDSFIFDITKKW